MWDKLVIYTKELNLSPARLILLLSFPVMGVAIGKYGILVAAAFLAVPVGLAFIISVFRKPYWGLLALFIYNYFVMGLTRYFPLPLGTGVDLLFVLTYVSLLCNTYFTKVEWWRARRDLTLLAAVWFAYGLLELFNPLAPTLEAWFYAMRGFSLYFFLTVPLTFILFHRYRDVKLVINLWAVFSLLAAIKGMIQQHIGLDTAEQIWLNEIGNNTHNLITGLRIFSIFTDAGHYGASMGMSLVMYGILAFQVPGWKMRIFYAVVALASLYGMMISGTRGALAVPLAGLGFYIVLSKNVKIIVTGIFLLLGTFVFFKYTTIGEGNYTIRRMRTAFDPKEPSLNTRLRNQRKLAEYLADKPFGGGIGSAGDWGMRFAPDSVLANIPTDSWFVAIWAEQGVVGLTLHLFILFYVLIKASLLVMFRVKNKELALRIKVLLAGIFGIMVASYGNGILGQFPTSIMFYMSQCFVLMSTQMDKELTAEKESDGKVV